MFNFFERIGAFVRKLLEPIFCQSKCKSCKYYRPDHTGFNGGTCDGNNEYGCSYEEK